MDAENLYYKLREVAEDCGCFISEEADDLLGEVAQALADHPNSQEENDD